MHHSFLILEEWHLWQVTSKVFLSINDLINIDVGMGEQVTDWLSLSSNVKVTKYWLIELYWSILVTTLSSLQFLLQIFDSLFITCNNALMLVYFLLEL